MRTSIVLLCALYPARLIPAYAAEWPPIDKEELAMTDDPKNPGASAIILYREVDSDDSKSLVTEYIRIKVLNDEGRRYADIEIPYLEKEVQIENIRARTVRPDGTAVEFGGQIFEKTVLRGRRMRLQVKSFTLPEVQKGSIIEYSHVAHARGKLPDVLKRPDDFLFDRAVVLQSAKWLLREDLSTRRARFIKHGMRSALLQWSYFGPGEVRPQAQADGSVILDLENQPAFQPEEYMAPEAEVRGWVGFYYLVGAAMLPNDYWRETGAAMAKELAHFLGDPKKFKSSVAGIVLASDPPETQLRKLYARVQQLHSASGEPVRSEQQIKREARKENKSVEDVLKHGYAEAGQINLTMVALARAAGFEAALLAIKSRDKSLFEPSYPPASELDANIVWVRGGGKDYFLDPGTRYCPFGLLPWEETITAGTAVSEAPTPIDMKIGKFLGLVGTRGTLPEQAVVKRDAILQLDSEGSVEGNVRVDFVGLEALERRLAAVGQDEASRRKALADEVKDWIAAPANVELDGTVNWEETEQPLRANFKIKVSEYAASTGRRLLFRAGFLDGAKKPFQSEQRVNDIYLPHPFQETDDVTWKLPSGFRAGSLAEKKELPTQYGDYTVVLQNVDGNIHFQRRLSLRKVYTPVNQYLALRAYMNVVRQGDESQIVLENSEAPNGNKPQ